MKAENKWDKEEDYIFLKKWIECNLKTDENLGIDKAIYEKLPKVIMQENKSELIDLSFINLSNLSFGKVWMGHYLSHANLSGSKFLRTHFHHAVAVDTDFSGSFFERAQFIPFFSPIYMSAHISPVSRIRFARSIISTSSLRIYQHGARRWKAY